MKNFLAFFKKELTEFIRSGKALTVTAVFILFALLNPLMTKLTPYLIEMLSDSLGEAGLIVGDMNADASMSWAQFFKNAPMLIVVFVFLFGGIFTAEYQSGTLILIITKGVERYKILLAKVMLLFAVWSVEYWLGFAITYGYNALYWDNNVVEYLFSASLYWWLFGVWIIGLLTLCSCFAKTVSSVLLGTGGGVFCSYLIGIVPTLTKYTPTYLMSVTTENALPAVLLTAILSVIFLVVSIPVFNKKEL